jgi:hypothetical protein
MFTKNTEEWYPNLHLERSAKFIPVEQQTLQQAVIAKEQLHAVLLHVGRGLWFFVGMYFFCKSIGFVS